MLVPANSWRCLGLGGHGRAVHAPMDGAVNPSRAPYLPPSLPNAQVKVCHQRAGYPVDVDGG